MGSDYGEFKVIPSCPQFMINEDWEVRNVRTGQVVPREKGEAWSVHIYDADGNRVHRAVRKLYKQAWKPDTTFS